MGETLIVKNKLQIFILDIKTLFVNLDNIKNNTCIDLIRVHCPDFTI